MPYRDRKPGSRYKSGAARLQEARYKTKDSRGKQVQEIRDKGQGTRDKGQGTRDKQVQASRAALRPSRFKAVGTKVLTAIEF